MIEFLFVAMISFRRANTKLKFEYNGEMLSIPELAEKLNIKPATLWMRYERTGSVFLKSAKMDGKDIKVPTTDGGKEE